MKNIKVIFFLLLFFFSYIKVNGNTPTFFEVKTLEEKTDIIKKWTQKMISEFPKSYMKKLPRYKPKSNYTYIKFDELELLLSDDIFPIFFGTSYTRLSENQIKIFQKYLKTMEKRKYIKISTELDWHFKILRYFIDSNVLIARRTRIIFLNDARKEINKKINQLNQSNQGKTICSILWYFDHELFSTKNAFWPSERKTLELKIEKCDKHLERRKQIKYEDELNELYTELSNSEISSFTLWKIRNNKYPKLLKNTSTSFSDDWVSKMYSLENEVEAKLMKKKYFELQQINNEDIIKLKDWLNSFEKTYGSLVLNKILVKKKSNLNHTYENIQHLFIDKYEQALLVIVNDLKEQILNSDEKDWKKIKEKYLLTNHSESNTIIEPYNQLIELIQIKESELAAIESEKLEKERNEKIKSQICSCCKDTPIDCFGCSNGKIMVYDPWEKRNVYRTCLVCGGKGYKFCGCCKMYIFEY